MNVLTIILIQIITFLIQIVFCEHDMRVITTLTYSKHSLTPAVVNGKPAKEGQFPFLVSFKEPLRALEPGKTVWGNICGGSIFAYSKVLTAAHCFEFNDFLYAKNPGILRVVAGNMRTDIVHDGKTETTIDGQWRMIVKVILHPGFIFPDNDIAIAVVNKPWVYTKKVYYVRMATSSVDYQHHCLSAGYGRLGYKPEDKVSPVMLTAEIEIVSRWRCNLLWEMNMDKFVCSSSSVTDVAMGDSGGPLICRRTGDPAEVNDDGLLVGVVSGKNVDSTTLYTRVSEFAAWILTDGKVGGGVGGAGGFGGIRPRNAADTLHMSLNGFWFITLFVLIYLLFYCLGPSQICKILFCRQAMSKALSPPLYSVTY